MASSQFVTYNMAVGSPNSWTDNQTYFLPLGGGLTSNILISEDQAEIPIRDAGIFSNLYTHVLTNTASVTSVITLRKSVSDTAVTVSYTSDQTGIKEDNTNTATFAATDEGCYSLVIPAEVGTNTIGLTVFGIVFTPTTTTDCITKMCVAGGSGNVNFDSGTRYYTAVGVTTAAATTEANSLFEIRGTFTASDFATFVSANARTTDTIFGSRKDGGAGAQSVTYTSGQTGAKEDTVNTDSLVAGSDYDYFVTTSTGTESLTIRTISTTLTSTANEFICMAGRQGGIPYGAGGTSYQGISGAISPTTNSDISAQILPRFTFTAKELVTWVSANTLNGDSVIAVRDDGADSAITVTYATTQTGFKGDNTNTAIITADTDEINYQIANAGSSGSTSYTYLGMIGVTSAPAGTAVKYQSSAHWSYPI